MTLILIPARSPEQWKDLLAEPERQWKQGYSARTLAYCWSEAAGFPNSVRAVFDSSRALAGLEPLLVLPEHQVALPGGARPSQTDVWVLAHRSPELVSIAVEGKVSEPFGPTLAEWLQGASPGKRERLAFLCELLGLPFDPAPELRYQLFHRMGSAILEAQRFEALHAVLLVHSFSPTDESFADFELFVGQFGLSAEPGGLVTLGRPGISLHFGWARGEPEYLQR